MISKDAIVFGLGFLNGPKAKLSFGGNGAQYQITDRAREALNNLLNDGYAKVAEPTDQIENREHYVGTNKQPSLGALAKDIGLNPFDLERWDAFSCVTEISGSRK